MAPASEELGRAGGHAIDRYFALQSEFLASLRATYGQSHEDTLAIEHAVDGSLKLLDALYLADDLRARCPRKILKSALSSASRPAGYWRCRAIGAPS